MEKVRRIITGIVSVIYLILLLMRIDIPSNIFITLLGVVLISEAIDEWNRYKKTRRKIHLLIPIIGLPTLIFITLYYFII